MTNPHNASSAGSAGLDVPPERYRTDEQRKDIQRAWDIVGMVTDGHLLNSTEGHLAVLRGIQMGRRLSVDDAQAVKVPAPNTVEMLRAALKEAAADIVGCCKDIDDPSVAEALRRISDARMAASQPSPAATVETKSNQLAAGTGPASRDGLSPERSIPLPGSSAANASDLLERLRMKAKPHETIAVFVALCQEAAAQIEEQRKQLNWVQGEIDRLLNEPQALSLDDLGKMALDQLTSDDVSSTKLAGK